MKRETKGWAVLCPTHKVETSVGAVTVRANVQTKGRRAGMRRIRSQNPDGSWTTVEIDAVGRLVGFAHADTEKNARAQLEAAAKAAREESPREPEQSPEPLVGFA